MTLLNAKKFRFLIPALLSGLWLSAPAAAQPAQPAPTAVKPAPAAAPAAPAEIPAAPETADTLLKRVDLANNSFKDAIFDFKMRIKEPGGGSREVEFTAYQKGSSKRLVRFQAPGDIKGMGILIENAESMYALLPQFGNRIRRIATHQMNGSFMGSDMNSDDMGMLELTPSFLPTLAGTDKEDIILDLKLRPGKNATFPHLKLWVQPKHALLSKIEYYDASGKKLRTQVRGDYRQDNPVGSTDHFSPFHMSFIDHVRNNHETELTLQKSQLNTNLSDDIFTQRSLQRGE
jgi:outer membrane lipoprotein-sorting protein